MKQGCKVTALIITALIFGLKTNISFATAAHLPFIVDEIANESNGIPLTTTDSTPSTPDKASLIYKLYNQIHWSGEVNVAGFSSNRTPTTMGVIPRNIGASPAASNLSIHYSCLTADTKLSDWFNILFNFAYAERAPSFVRSPAGGGNTFFVDKAYVGIANARVTPFYAQIGRQFIPFGGPEFSTVSESMTELLSLTRRTNIIVGIKKWYGLDANVYAFQGIDNVTNRNSSSLQNFGANLGFGQQKKQWDYYFGAGFVNNIAGALYTNNTFANNSVLGNQNAYTKMVSGLDLNAKLRWNTFDANLKYIGALQAFSVADVPFTNDSGATLIGAKPAAWGANIGYAFAAFNHASHLGVGYQGSKQATALGTTFGSVTNSPAGIYGDYFAIGMPENRIYANYQFLVIKWVSLTAEIMRDGAYPVRNGGTNKSALTGILQLTARFT